MLNHKDPIECGAMRRLVAAWDAAGRDARRTVQTVPELRPYLYGDESSQPLWGATFETNGSGLQVRLVPDDTRMPPRVTQNDTRMRIACVRFVQFLLAEHRERLAGPCKWKHCGKYFLLKGNRRTLYCSRLCCQHDAASRCNKTRWLREHADKLQRAKNAAGRWLTARTKDDWKAFVSKYEPDITPKFLTRAVNNNELQPPTKERKR